MVTKDTKEEEEATCPLVRFSKQNKSLSYFKTPSKQSNVHSQANPKWVSIPQDWGKRWKDGWVVTLTKLSPRTHWLIGADPAFLQALYLGTTLRIFKRPEQWYCQTQNDKTLYIKSLLGKLANIPLCTEWWSPKWRYKEQMMLWVTMFCWQGHDHVEDAVPQTHSLLNVAQKWQN